MRPIFSDQRSAAPGRRTWKAHPTVTTSAARYLPESVASARVPSRRFVTALLNLVDNIPYPRDSRFSPDQLRRPLLRCRRNRREMQERGTRWARPSRLASDRFPASNPADIPNTPPHPLPARRAGPVRGASGPGSPAGRCRARRGSPASDIRARPATGRSARARRTSPIRTRSPGADAAGGS